MFTALLEPDPIKHLLDFDLVGAYSADRDGFALEWFAGGHGFEGRVVKRNAHTDRPLIVAVCEVILSR